MSAVDEARLTPRERAVLALAARGLTNKEIAAALCISPRTVGAHLLSVYDKLGVHTRTAAAWTLRNGGDDGDGAG